jgi:hypothetical protein
VGCNPHQRAKVKPVPFFINLFRSMQNSNVFIVLQMVHLMIEDEGESEKSGCTTFCVGIR